MLERRTPKVYRNIYLENSKGEIIRSIRWGSDEMHVVQRIDTGRIEMIHNISLYEKSEIPFVLLKSFKLSTFDRKTPHQDRFTLFLSEDKNSSNYLKIVSEVKEVQPSIPLQEDDEKRFFVALKQTSSIAAILSLLLFMISFFLPPVNQGPELHMVQIVDRHELEIEKITVTPQQTPRIVKPIESHRKNPEKVVQKIIAKRLSKKSSDESMGTNEILGSFTKSNQKGGLDLNQVNAEKSRGIGLGGSEGSGGIQNSIYSKGLTAAPLGSGNNLQGGGGYGTRGKGGGQAGYGKITISGNGGQSFLHPVTSEALVEGGLDRNEIAAVIERHISEVRYCYEQGLQRNVQLSGRISMQFMIGPKGQVTSAGVSNSSLSSLIVENCIQSHLKTWPFPRPRGGVTVKVNYPFVLKRVGES